MQQGERNTLRIAAATVETLCAQFADESRSDVAAGKFDILAGQVCWIDNAFPGLLPPFDAGSFRGRFPPQFNLYEAGRIRAWLCLAMTCLRTALDNASTAAPWSGAMKLDFSFVADAPLRAIIERDYAEIGRASTQACWKSVIILSGGILEALLTDALRDRPERPAQLIDLTNKAFERGLVSKGVKDLSHTLREFRNLVHPDREIRDRLHVDEDEARVALAILAIVRRDLAAQPR